MRSTGLSFVRYCTTVIGLILIDANLNRASVRVANRNRNRRVANGNRGAGVALAA